jgi:hypothetical protein
MDKQPLLSNAVQAEAVRVHRRQRFWRIWLPVILAGLLVIGVTVLVMVTTAGGGNDQDTHWANISLIWILIPTILGSLIWLALLAGLIFVMMKVLNATPTAAGVVQHYFMLASQLACTFSDKVSAPVIKTKSIFAGARRLKNRLVGR